MSFLGKCGQRLEEYSLYAVLFLLPFSKASVEVGFGLLLLGWLLSWCDPSTRPTTIWTRPQLRLLAWWLLGYLAACAASIFVSDFPEQSVKGFIGKWAEYLLYFVLVAELGARPKVAERTIAVIAWSSLCVMIEGLHQERFHRGLFIPRPMPPDFMRMTGPYENPIDLATYLMVVIPPLLVAAVNFRGWKRWAVGGLTFLLTLCLARTRALGAWIGFGMGLASLLLIRRRLWRLGLGLAAILAIVGALFLYQHGSLGTVFSLSEIGKVDRLMMWQAALRMIHDRPVLGHGVNTFMANYLRYWVGGEQQPRYAHNCYLQVAAETGLIGLTMLLGLLGTFFVRLLVRMRPGPGQVSPHSLLFEPSQLLLAGLFAGLLAFALQSGIDTNFYALRQAALFWIVSGLALGLSERSVSKSNKEARVALFTPAGHETQPSAPRQ